VPDEPVHLVKAKLIAEGPGILNWMIAGAVAWLNDGTVPEPELAKRASASFWATSSALGEWIEACCDLSDPEARSAATPLYQHFKQFCIDRGDKEDRIISQTRFGNDLNNAQIYSIPNHVTGKKERVGIRLKDGSASGGSIDPGTWADDDWLPV
jgi:putative DNA primase/helicase